MLKRAYKPEKPSAIKKILTNHTNHKKKLSHCLMIIPRLDLRLNIDQFIEDWKY